MPANSEILINSETHSNLNANLVETTSAAFKGDGYYGWGDGLHTVSYQVTSFIGTIKMQATLTAFPEESDWFDVDDTVVDGMDTEGFLLGVELLMAGEDAELGNDATLIVWDNPDYQA